MTALHQRAIELHRSAVVADTHNDLLMSVSARAPESWGDFFRERWLPQLRAGAVDLQVLPVWVDMPAAPETGLRTMLRMIECAHTLTEANAEAVALCTSGRQVREAIAKGRIGLVLALEGCGPIGTDVELLTTMSRLGVRMASLAHFGRTALADGSGEDGTGGRLTRAGVAALHLMHELGVLHDVSHLGVAGVEHTLELAHGPLIASHSCARSLCDHHRNLTDDQLRGIAGTGGVVCVNFFAGFVHPTDHTLDRLLDQIEHVIEVCGVEAVGLGPDFVREVELDLTPPWSHGVDEEGLDATWCIPGLEGPGGLPLVTEALLRRGWAREDVRCVLGGNVLRLFVDELGHTAPSV